MNLTREGYHMMFTKGVNVYVANYNHFIVILLFRDIYLYKDEAPKKQHYL